MVAGDPPTPIKPAPVVTPPEPVLLDRNRKSPGDPGYATTVPNSINNNYVSSRFYVNLFGSIRVHGDRNKGVELFGAINNLFDRKYFTQAFACSGNQATSLYPEAGRSFVGTLRVAL